MSGNMVAQWAIIAVVAVILAIIVVNTNRRLMVQDRLAKLSGQIDQPAINASLERSIQCSGSVQQIAGAPKVRYLSIFARK
jgi:cell division protein FtsL